MDMDVSARPMSTIESLQNYLVISCLFKADERGSFGEVGLNFLKFVVKVFKERNLNFECQNMAMQKALLLHKYLISERNTKNGVSQVELLDLYKIF